jgi:hypothetical protein
MVLVLMVIMMKVMLLLLMRMDDPSHVYPSQEL